LNPSIDNDNDFPLDLSIKVYRLRGMDHPLVEAYQTCQTTYERSRMLRQGGRQVFAAQLRKARADLGMTCRQLGAAIGVTGQLISQIETTAKSILSYEQVKEIVCLCSEGKPRSKQKAGSKNAEVG
jgi:DNA-binding XRE family transcriptional regulator